jgi:hypothetical protein
MRGALDVDGELAGLADRPNSRLLALERAQKNSQTFVWGFSCVPSMNDSLEVKFLYPA